jgi:integration host factor subunit alpha
MARRNKNATIRDLTSRTKKATGVEKEKIKKIIELYFEEIKNAILNGKQVRLGNFGTFELKTWKESTYFDPHTKKMMVKKIKAVSFKPSTILKNKIKSG